MMHTNVFYPLCTYYVFCFNFHLILYTDKQEPVQFPEVDSMSCLLSCLELNREKQRHLQELQERIELQINSIENFNVSIIHR